MCKITSTLLFRLVISLLVHLFTKTYSFSYLPAGAGKHKRGCELIHSLCHLGIQSVLVIQACVVWCYEVLFVSNELKVLSLPLGLGTCGGHTSLGSGWICWCVVYCDRDPGLSVVYSQNGYST